MQLFKFLNSIIKSNGSKERKLQVSTYEVTPLTREVGLIGWAPGCRTLHDLIKTYRAQHNIALEAEYNEAMVGVKDYPSLPIEEKLFIFKRGLRATQGNDLNILLFRNSSDTNHWLERRLLFTSSLASTSMFGYILGLGDRHMSNIMFDEVTAKLVHIDFGDCFEVAQHRDKFPEKVPFRLTRMLTNALEPAGVSGTFRQLCFEVLSVARQKCNYISGLLEAFVYDPLLQWGSSDSRVAGGIVKRIEDKLTGHDYNCSMDTETQVDKLISEASDPRNICQMYRGWFPYW